MNGQIIFYLLRRKCRYNRPTRSHRVNASQISAAETSLREEMTVFVEILVVGASYITRRSGVGKGYASFSVYP